MQQHSFFANRAREVIFFYMHGIEIGTLGTFTDGGSRSPGEEHSES
jgi:hypothetical protein